MLEKPQTVFKNLYKKLKTQTPICLICFKEIKNVNLGHIYGKTPQLCDKCRENLIPNIKSFYVDGIKATSIYDYDENIKSLLYQFKGCYDIALKSVFLHDFSSYYSLIYKDYYLVPAPSYISEDIKRGFNHVKEIFSILNLKIIDCFVKTDNIKQSSNDYNKRKEIKNIIKMSETNIVKNKNILLVDDIYTTGSTLKAMISLLKQAEVKDIKILVLAKTKLESN